MRFSNNHEEEIGAPDVINDVSAVTDQKIGAMKAHISQTGWMIADREEKLKQKDPETLAWLQYERFWNYQWENDQVK